MQISILRSQYVCYLVAAVAISLVADLADAAPPMIWLSPRNVSYDNFVSEDFSAARGVWADVATGAGSRTDSPVVHVDSKGLLWIYGGNPSFFIRLTSGAPMHNYTSLNAVWTYDMHLDKYRWVAGRSDYDGQLSNFGQIGVPSNDVFPGLKGHSAHAIDKNDNIWIYGGLNGNDDGKQPDNTMWMFNTTSLQFTWIGGDTSNTNATFGKLGEASAEYWPGLLSGAQMIVDSKNNLWMFGGSSDQYASSGVWLFDTTSRMWSLQWGDPLNGTTVDYGGQIWNGRFSPGITIDEEDRVWLFGGYGSIPVYYASFYSDMWSFDTKTVTWRVEREMNLNLTLPDGNISSYDTFDVNNYPPRRDMVSMVDRRDGTIMVYGGRSPYDTAYFDIWVFNKTSKLWKIVYGGPYNGTVHHLYGEYRGTGSQLGTRRGHAAEAGLNAKGHMIIMGGDNYMHTAFNDVWIIPQDPCLTTLHDCDPNASCVTPAWDQPYQCTCKAGYNGDGKTCLASPSVVQPTSPSAKVSSAAFERGLETLVISTLSLTLIHLM